MSDTVFTGKFQKPVEAFAVQDFDPTALNRLTADALFWIMIVVAVALAIHFAVATLPGLLRKEPVASRGSGPDTQAKRRDAAQIAYHWLNAAAIVTLTYTGLAISFGFPEAAGNFLWHLWAAWILLAALVFHIWYATVHLNHFRRMWLTRAEMREALARFQGGSASKPGFYKAEQIALHWVLTALVLGLIVTGFMLWKPGRDFVGPFWLPWGWDAVFIARVLHQIFTFLLIALVVAHVYFAVLVPKEWPRLKSIFTGRVPLSWYRTQHKVSPQVEAKARAVESRSVGMKGAQRG